MAVGAVACAAAPSYPALLVLRFLQGIFCPFVFAVVVAYLQEEMPVRAARLNAVYVAGTAFGGFTGRFLAGLLASLTGSWRWSFLGNAALLVVIALAAQAGLPRETHFTPSGAPGSSAQARSTGSASPLRDWRVLLSCFVGFSLLFQQVAVFTYGSLTLEAAPFDLSQAAIGFIFVVMLLPTVITPSVGVVIERHGLLAVLLTSQLLAAVSLALMGIPSVAAIIAGFAGSCVSVFAGQTCATRFIASHVRQGTSSAVGVYLFSYYLGGTVGGWLPQAPYERWGWDSTLVLVAVVLVASTVAAAAAWRRPVRH